MQRECREREREKQGSERLARFKKLFVRAAQRGHIHLPMGSWPHSSFHGELVKQLALEAHHSAHEEGASIRRCLHSGACCSRPCCAQAAACSSRISTPQLSV